MTSFSMFLSFIMLVVGGYGFSSTKVASLNLPLMEKIAPTVHSWAFLNPLICGVLLFVYAVYSVSDKYSMKMLQATLAIMCAMLVFDAPALYACTAAFAAGGRPNLEVLLQGESGVAALLFVGVGQRALRKRLRNAELTKPQNDPGVSSSVTHQVSS